jgi:prepilin-type N-terminal cleavage/methylation domain-containing protein
MSTRRSRVTPTRARRGMSLVEVLVAMVILTGVLLTLGNFSARFAQANGQAHLTITANEIAASRLDEIRTQPTYAALDSLATVGKADTVRKDNTAFARVTKIIRVGSALAADSTDYKMMTVIVSHPAMKTPVSKSTAIAAF